MRVLATALAAVLSVLLSLATPAQAEYPEKPIRLVVPFPPGGPTDALGRILSERMGRALGQSIIVDNVSGAGGTLGVAKVARAAADGYTLSIAQTTSNVFSVAVYKVPYDVLADFEPVALISSSALMMIGRADLPASNLKELIASLKAAPQSASFATVSPSASRLVSQAGKNQATRRTTTSPVASRTAKTTTGARRVPPPIISCRVWFTYGLAFAWL